MCSDRKLLIANIALYRAKKSAIRRFYRISLRAPLSSLRPGTDCHGSFRQSAGVVRFRSSGLFKALQHHSAKKPGERLMHRLSFTLGETSAVRRTDDRHDFVMGIYQKLCPARFPRHGEAGRTENMGTFVHRRGSPWGWRIENHKACAFLASLRVISTARRTA
jgi:hypothetical protein